MQRCRVFIVTAEPNRMSGSASKTLRIRLFSSASGGHTRRICDIVRLLRRVGGARGELKAPVLRPAPKMCYYMYSAGQEVP